MWWNWKFWRVVMWPLPQRREVLGELGEGLHLLGRDAAEGQLHADHLHVGLALAVDALLEPEADELRPPRSRRSRNSVDLGVEVVELALEDRDHVPRDVLVDLGVLAAIPCGPWLGLAFCGTEVGSTACLLACGLGVRANIAKRRAGFRYFPGPPSVSGPHAYSVARCSTSLSDKLQAVLSDVRSRGKLNEDDVNKAMREIRLALLEADVNFKVVKELHGDAEGAVRSGQEVLESLNPGQQVVKIVNEELTALMGEASRQITLSPNAADGDPDGRPAGLGQDDRLRQARAAARRRSRQGRRAGRLRRLPARPPWTSS